MSCVLNELMQYDDLSDFCRVCLRLPDESQLLDLTKIYDEEKNLSFASCFTICTQIDLEALEGIPHNLCKSCGLELQIVYDFNKKIEESENILLEYENQLAIEGDEPYLDDMKKDVAYNTNDFSTLDCNYEKDEPAVQHQKINKEEDFNICKDNAFNDAFAKVCKSQENDDDDNDNDSIRIIEEDLIVTTVSSSSSEFDEEDIQTNFTPFEEESRQNNQPVCNQVNFNEFVDFMEAYNNELFGEDDSEVAPANGGDHDVYIKKEMNIISTVEPKTIDPDLSKDVPSNSQELKKFKISLFQKDNDGDIDMIGEANDDNIKNIKIEIPISSMSGIIYEEDIEIKQEPPFEEEQTNIETSIATTTINSVISEEAIEIKPLEDEQMNIDIPIPTITKEALDVQPFAQEQMVKTNNRSLLKPLPAKVNNRYVCDGCDKIFGDIGSLLIHRSYKCLKYHCNYCEKAYTKKLSLTRHISVAHQKNYNSHSCSICKKFFVRANKLQQHMLNYHKDQLPFKCSLCDRKYSLAKTLKSHEKLKHSNERLYCSYEACDRVFSCPTNLRHHEYLHNEMPYECDICNIGCASKDKLRCHLKQRHNVVEVESDMLESEENELISTSEPKAIAQDDINEVSFNSQEWKEFEIRLFQSDNDADSENGKIKKIRIGIPISSSTAAIISEEAIEIQEEQPFGNEQTDIEIPISETAGVNTIISKEAIEIKEELSVADEQMKIEIPSSSISEEAIDIKEEQLSEEEEEEQPSEEEEEQPFEEEEQPFEKEEEEQPLEDEQMNIKISSISEKQTFEQQQMVKTKSYEPNLLKKSYNIYTCDNCDEKFSDFGSMIIHRSYKCYKYHCTYCKKGFQEKLVYSRHLSVAHRKNMSFSCSICKKLFAGADKLKHHMQRFHHKGGQLSFKCSLCDRKYSKAKYLITHEQLKHADQRCSYKACGRIFSCPTSLRQHEYSHGEMPFECNICKTGCPSKYKLKCHLKNIHNILELDIQKLESMRKFKKRHSKANTVVPANDVE